MKELFRGAIVEKWGTENDEIIDYHVHNIIVVKNVCVFIINDGKKDAKHCMILKDKKRY